MKKIDESGFRVLKANPISRVGVYPYLGKQIDLDKKLGLEPMRVYRVLRPDYELFAQEAIDSFNGIPFIDEHEMLGDQFTPVEKRPAQGVIFNVRPSLDNPGYLIADFKIFTKSMTEKIDSGKKELSLGYYCKYEQQAGVFNGEPYEFIQTHLRGNHIALVEHGRCGSSVRVCDSALSCDGVLTCDSIKEILDMDGKEDAKKEAPVNADAPAKALAACLKGACDARCQRVIDFLKEDLEKYEDDGVTLKQKGDATADGSVPPPPPSDDKGEADANVPAPADATNPPADAPTAEAPADAGAATAEAPAETGAAEEKPADAPADEAPVAEANAAEATPPADAEKTPEDAAQDGCCGGEAAKDGCCGDKDCGGKPCGEPTKDGCCGGEPTKDACGKDGCCGAAKDACGEPAKDSATAECPCKEGETCASCAEPPAKMHEVTAAGAENAPEVSSELKVKGEPMQDKCDCGMGKNCPEGDKDSQKTYPIPSVAKDELFREFSRQVSRRNSLYKMVKPYTNAFAHDEMTEAEVARYACQHIEDIKWAADSADEACLFAVRGYLSAKKAAPVEKKEFAVVKDEAITKTPASDATGDALKEYLGKNA